MPTLEIVGSKNRDGSARPSERGVGYREITQALIADIKAGDWKPGDQFPTEAELVERFNSSRATVRESLRELETFGFVKRRRGTRSILISADPSSAFANSVQSVSELMQYTRRTVSSILTRELTLASPYLADRLEVEIDSKWLRVEILRRTPQGSLPIGYSEIYINGMYAEIANDLDDKVIAVYSMLEERYGVIFQQVAQKIEAAAANANVASRLKIEVGSPVLEVRTDFIASGGREVEIGFSYFPAGRYHIDVLLERSGGRLDE
jgi:GntR family transcriptional regulator